jgi:hypothetical protein
MSNKRTPNLLAASLLALAMLADAAEAEAEPYKLGVEVARPNLAGQVARPLRYRPQGEDFVIENGGEFFNRPLYGGNTGFRVDGGDRPEFSLYLPGRGGNVRLGVKTPAGTVWLHQARSIVTRYRPGELHYEIADPLLGAGGRIYLAAVAYAAVEGLALQVSGQALPDSAELVFAFAPGNGARGRRGGDIGTEAVPISQYFQFTPADALGSIVDLHEHGLEVSNDRAVITATAAQPLVLRRADAAKWDDLPGLLCADAGSEGHVAVGRLPLNDKRSTWRSRSPAARRPPSWPCTARRAALLTPDLRPGTPARQPSSRANWPSALPTRSNTSNSCAAGCASIRPIPT